VVLSDAAPGHQPVRAHSREGSTGDELAYGQTCQARLLMAIDSCLPATRMHWPSPSMLRAPRCDTESIAHGTEEGSQFLSRHAHHQLRQPRHHTQPPRIGEPDGGTSQSQRALARTCQEAVQPRSSRGERRRGRAGSSSCAIAPLISLHALQDPAQIACVLFAGIRLQTHHALLRQGSSVRPQATHRAPPLPDPAACTCTQATDQQQQQQQHSASPPPRRPLRLRRPLRRTLIPSSLQRMGCSSCSSTSGSSKRSSARWQQ